MAVERMEKVNIIGHIEDVDDVAKKLILSSTLHVTASIDEIKDIKLKITCKDSPDEIIDNNYIKEYKSTKSLDDIKQKLDILMDSFNLKQNICLAHIEETYDLYKYTSRVDNLYTSVNTTLSKLKELNDQIDQLKELEKYITNIKSLNIDLSEIFNMNRIQVKMGNISSYDMDKLQKNYENIKAIVIKLHQESEKIKILLFIPEEFEKEVEDILLSLNFEEFKPSCLFYGTPEISLRKIKLEEDCVEKEISDIKAQLKGIGGKNRKTIERLYSRLVMEMKVEELKGNIVRTNEFFYITGWVPTSKKKKLLKLIGKDEERLIILFKAGYELEGKTEPPTKLNNGTILKPFEALVKLYGIPAYRELDPTAFLGITYMFLFGAMFGDVGQGAVFFFMGFYLSRKKGMQGMGSIIQRLGVSSIVFGFLYGSLFGFEDILPVYLVKPLEEINLVLIAAVVIGIILITVGYILRLINAYRTKDIENGLFSGNGLAGLAFYWMLIYIIITNVLGKKPVVPFPVSVIFLVILTILMIFRQPIAHLLMGVRPLYNESKLDYYVESGFGVIEMTLSMLSNTISFIRVGAFAINHVGLFIAFETLANMMNSGAASVMTMIIGNIVIMGLEGLIVFIQGLRLEYYELFSKYFKGTGYDYVPYFIVAARKRKVTRKLKLSKAQIEKQIKININ